MMGSETVAQDDHTAREEAKGKDIWQRLQNKEVECANLSDDDFGALGEYFMGQMVGSSHPSMNQMMTSMMGEEREEQAHVVMGKRLSACDTTVAFPSQAIGLMPMMQMMAGRGLPMMNFGYGFGSFGLFFMLLWWALIIVALVALVKWLINQFKSESSHKTPLNILKERYARGEIDRKEFEEKKKELE